MLLEIPIRVNEFGSKELFDALIACLVIQDPQRRKQLIKLLDKSIASNIASIESASDTVHSILEAFSGFPNKIDELLEAIKRLELESTEYKNLYDVIFKIAIEQQKQTIELDSGSTPNIFEELHIGVNNYNEIFENLWSEICPILDEINWIDIWKACFKFENLIKNNEIRIKSLCFTKNYNLLKQIFLDQYEPNVIIIELCRYLKSCNQKLELLLRNIQDIHELKDIYELSRNKIKSEQNNNEYVFCSPPILLIIVNRLGDGKGQDKWNVRGQFKTVDKQSEILISQDKQGLICKNFEEIPKVIKIYIDFLETDDRFRHQKIDKLRVEVFLPLSEIRRNIDNWAIDFEESYSIPIITKHRLFIRIQERISKRKNARIELLKQGWGKIENFLKSDQSISKASLVEIIKKSKIPNLIEISNVPNWIELIDCIEHCPSLWCMRWKGTLPNDKSDQINFFGSILDSGIPIVFWNWHSIPQEVEVELETKFADFLCRDNLVDRCQQLLETTWSLRRVAWGEEDEIKRQKRPGYYFGMLLEDPEILPEDNPLQTIGAK